LISFFNIFFSSVFNKSILLNNNTVLIEYAFEVSKNLSIKFVDVVGPEIVTIKKTTSILEAKICVCFDKLTDFLKT
jgi:hypothetical protein